MFMHKKNVFVSLLFALLFVGTSMAADVQLRPNHPDRYVVVKGDTLWDISARFLKDPWLWPDIWYANPQIKNPHLIYPGDVVTLVYVGGKPRIMIQRGHPEVKLTPHGRIEPLAKAIPTIPLDAIRPFLSRSLVLSEDDLKTAPYVVAAAGEHIAVGADERIYVRKITAAQPSRFTVVRPGGAYKDPKTGEVLGYEALYLGDALLQRTGDPATLKLLHTEKEVIAGDRLVPASDEAFTANFFPKAPSKTINGDIIAVLGGVSQIGQNQVVVIDRGARDGLEVGDVLAVYQRGQVIPDVVSAKRNDTVQLPDERAGELMVFRTFDKVSYGLIMRATTAMHVLDLVRNP
jgi:hypothetical protein